MWPRMYAVIRREYLEHVRTKAFWISTLLVPVFMTAMMVIPAWLASRGAGEFDIAVLDLTGRYYERIESEVGGQLSGDREALTVRLSRVAPEADLEGQRERLKERVQSKEFDGVLVLPATLPDEGQPEYVAPNVAAFRLLATLERSVNDVVVADRLTGAGLDAERVGELTRPVGLMTLKLGAKGEETEDQGQTFLLSYFLMLIIFMSVFGYGVYVMRGVLEEKSSHIVEVVISTVRPFELMLGKILGIGAVGLTQMLLWSGLALAATAPGAALAVGLGAVEMPTIPLGLMVYFVIYFVLGFLLYGTFYAGVGAAFSTEQEAQNFQGVLMLFFMAPLLLMMLVLNDPDGVASVVLSLIPIFTPTLMFLRMTLVKVPLAEVLASIVLLVLSIVASAWVVGKIYRVGILMHGSKPKLRDLLRWVREA